MRVANACSAAIIVALCIAGALLGADFGVVIAFACVTFALSMLAI